MKLTLDSLLAEPRLVAVPGVPGRVTIDSGSAFDRNEFQFYEDTSDSARAVDWLDSQLGDVPLRHVSDTGIAFDVRPVWPRDHVDAATVGDTGAPHSWLRNETVGGHGYDWARKIVWPSF